MAELEKDCVNAFKDGNRHINKPKDQAIYSKWPSNHTYNN